MKYRILHRTAYQYSEPASLSQNELYLQPRETGSQKVISHHLSVAPNPQYSHLRTDYFGNAVQVFMVQQPHDELVMTAQSTIELAAPSLPEPGQTPAWESVVDHLTSSGDPDALEARQFVFPSPLVEITPEIRAFAHSLFAPSTPVLVGAVGLVHRIYSEFTYDKSATTIDSSVSQVFSGKKGVCQDFAHLAISGLRSLGLAARYVSGYLKTLPPPGKSKLVGADASHAWISLFIPGTGWIDLDPTNNLMPRDTHITLAWGRDYGDVTPVKGVVMGGGSHALSVSVDVKAIG